MLGIVLVQDAVSSVSLGGIPYALTCLLAVLVTALLLRPRGSGFVAFVAGAAGVYQGFVLFRAPTFATAPDAVGAGAEGVFAIDPPSGR